MILIGKEEFEVFWMFCEYGVYLCEGVVGMVEGCD